MKLAECGAREWSSDSALEATQDMANMPELENAVSVACARGRAADAE
jgi:hypothetical protein